MKVKVYFDNAEERYKIYNGDTVINATEVTINEVAIDEQLSDTSANAVENRAVKKALDDNKSYSQEIVGSLNEKVGTLNSRVSNLLDVIGADYTVISPEDLGTWDWTATPSDPNSKAYGTSEEFSLPPNTLTSIFIPPLCKVQIEGKTGDRFYPLIGLGNISNDSYQFLLFNTGEYDTYQVTVFLAVDNTANRTSVESETTLYSYGIPQELKDIRVDYYGTIHDTAGDSVRYGMQLQKQTQDELEDVRVDAYGFEWSSAGDSVRSIMEAIATGKVDLGQRFNWINVSSQVQDYTSTAKAENVALPTNTEIKITLPAETQIIFNNGTDSDTLGDITAEDIQELTYTTDDSASYVVYANSNSLSYNDLIEAIDIYIALNISGGGTVDTAMSDSSENAVQNKVIKAYVDNGLEDKQDTLVAGSGVRIGSRTGSNMFNVATQVNGYLASNGTIAQNDDLRTSDFIEIEANKTYTVSSIFATGSPQYFIATYDTNKSNGNRIAVNHGTNVGTDFHYYTFTPTQNGYIRFSYDKNETNVMLNEGATYKAYEPYGEIQNVISVVGGKSNLIIVDKNGNGDYTTLTEACTNAPNGSTILVYPAVYDNEIVKAGDKELSIIGVDKDKCIIQNDSGAYNDDPIQMTSGYLANVTVKANASSSYVYDSSVSENYCLHIDAGGVSKEMTVENCNFISYHWACIGIGLHQDQKVTIKNCELLNVQNDYSHRRLALSFHEGTGSNITNQLLILDNCRIRSKAGKTISYQRVSTTSYMELRFYNNVFYDEINSTNCLSGDFSRNGKYLNDTQTLELSGDSYGNNVSDFNI